MFDIQGDKIVLSVDTLAIPPFKDYYNSHEDKDLALKDIEYVVWLYKWNTPYRAYPVSERASRVAIDVYKDDKFLPSEELIELSNRFNEFQSTPLIRLFIASEDSEEYLTKVLNNYKDADLDIDIAIKVAKLTLLVESVGKSVDSAKKRAMAELVETGRVKGGGTIGIYEMPRK